MKTGNLRQKMNYLHASFFPALENNVTIEASQALIIMLLFPDTAEGLDYSHANTNISSVTTGSLRICKTNNKSA